MNWLAALPPFRRLATVSVALRLVAVVVILLVAAAVVLQVRMTRTALVAETEKRLISLDIVFAEQTGRTIETVDLLVNGALELVQMRLEQSRGLDGIDGLLQRRIRGVRQLAYLLVVDPAGHLLVSSGLQPDAVPTASVDQLLARYRSDPRAGLVISAPFRDRDGMWDALLARPIFDAGGRLIGVAAGAINLDYFEAFYRSVELDENGTILLMLRNGIVLVRFPRADMVIGTSFAQTPPFTQVLTHAAAGTVLMDSPIDGTLRVTAIRALRLFPLAVMVSVSQASVLAGWRHDAFLVIAAALPLGGAMVGLILLLARRSRQVERLLEEARTARNVAEMTRERLLLQIEERERAEAVLRQAQRIESIGQLTGGIAHDFNNLLTVVLGNVDILQRRLGSLTGGVPRQAPLDAIRLAAQRGATLTRHLLAFARRQPLLPRPVDLSAAIRDMRGLLESALSGKATLQFQFASDLWAAMVDQSQIELVVLNLVINARDAMPNGGFVAVETCNHRRHEAGEPDGPPAGDYVRISVRDNGTGMPPEVLSRVFEPFFTTKATGAGSGLGLSQVFGTARQSGGEVRVQSKVAQGTTVIVDLPRARVAARQTVARSQRTGHRAGGAGILLVEDDDAVRAIAATVLREVGYNVREAPDAQSALNLLRQDRGIDALVTDVAMPDANGAQLAHTARTLRPGLPIVLMTGHAHRPDNTPSGAILIRKPFEPGILYRTVAAVLARAQAQGCTEAANAEAANAEPANPQSATAGA